MINKELQMERFDAGQDSPEQFQAAPDQAGPSRLQQLLSSETLAADDTALTAQPVQVRPAGYRGRVDDDWEDAVVPQVDEASRLQALAQEKIGYEEDTDKFFIDGAIDPRREALSPEQRSKVFGKTERPVPLESLNGPPLVFGGMLMGASLTMITLIAMGKFEVANETNWYIITGIVAAVGLMYAAQLRN
jgi:hypothetical protein